MRDLVDGWADKELWYSVKEEKISNIRVLKNLILFSCRGNHLFFSDRVVITWLPTVKLTCRFPLDEGIVIMDRMRSHFAAQVRD